MFSTVKCIWIFGVFGSELYVKEFAFDLSYSIYSDLSMKP